MTELRAFNLIHFLDFYFALMFFYGTIRRWRQYRSMAQIAVSGPKRWPKLLQLIKEHRTLFMTWATVAPLALALGVWMIQLSLSRFLFPEAGNPPHGLTLGGLLDNWPFLIPATIFAIAMFSVDLYFIICIGQVDQAETETYFDQAEYWLNSATAHVVRIATFGFVNPRRMVRDEVQKALVSASGLLNASLWWWNLQVTLRLAFAFILWLAWALS